MKAGKMGRWLLAGLAFATSVGFVLTTGGPAGAQAGLQTALVNVNSAGQKAVGGPSTRPDVSNGGLSIAFASRATNLVPGDTNGLRDIFVRRPRFGQTLRVSVSTAGAQANSDSNLPSIDASSRFVAYESEATNLVAGDTNGERDVFVRDVTGGTTRRVSVSGGGAQGIGGASGAPDMSQDGRFVAFISRATNLVPGDTNGAADIFVHDLETGAITRVSVGAGGTQGDADSFHAAIGGSGGRFIAFASRATNLVPGDTNGATDVFRHDRVTGVTTRISVATDGTQADGPSEQPSISANLAVAFQSRATNLVPGDTNRQSDIFIRRITAAPRNTTARVSVTSGGAQGDGSSFQASLAYPFIAFTSSATNLVSGDTNRVSDVFRRGLLAGEEETQRWSVASDGSQAILGPQGSSEPVIDSFLDVGHTITYVSDANNLVPGDTLLTTDVFQTSEP